MIKHTEGPWACFPTSYHAHDYRLSRPDGAMVFEGNDTARANARLIAAAPDLLAALVQIIEAEFGFGAWPNEYELRSLIAKIRGEP